MSMHVIQAGQTVTIRVEEDLDPVNAAIAAAAAAVAAAGAATASANATRADTLAQAFAQTTAQLSVLGSIATQAASAVTITGGSVTGITDLAVADGGTGASDAATARGNLGVDAAGFSHPGYISGRYYAAPHSAVGALVVTTDTLYGVPIAIYKSVTISTLLARVNTAGAAGTAMRAGIYSNVAGNPSAKLAEASAPVSTAAVAVSLPIPLASSVTLTPGVYWLVSIYSGAPAVRSIDVSDQTLGPWLGVVSSDSALTATTNSVTGVQGNATYASGLPATFGTATQRITGTPLLAVQVA